MRQAKLLEWLELWYDVLVPALEEFHSDDADSLVLHIKEMMADDDCYRIEKQHLRKLIGQIGEGQQPLGAASS